MNYFGSGPKVKKESEKGRGKNGEGAKKPRGFAV